MRILLVADHYPPDTGGLAIQVQRIAARLSDAGHQAAVFAASDAPSVTTEGSVTVERSATSLSRLPVYQEGSPPFHPPWPDPLFRRGLAGAIERFAPDVLHIHGWSAFSAASLPGHPPIVYTAHDYGMRCPKKSLLRHGTVCEEGRGVRCVTCDSEAQPTPRRVALSAAIGAGWPWLHRRIGRLLPVSEYVARRHLETGMAPDKVVVVPPLIDPLPEVAPRVLDGGAPYMLYLGPGPEQPYKGREGLLRAMQRVDPRGHELMLVGGREPVQAPGIVDSGYLKGDALAATVRGAEFSVVPSLWADPCPATAVEALGAGKPVIASAIGGLTDIVDHERTGLLVPPGDEAALAAAVQRLLDDEGLRRTLGANAARAVGKYSTESVLPALESAYAAAAR